MEDNNDLFDNDERTTLLYNKTKTMKCAIHGDQYGFDASTMYWLKHGQNKIYFTLSNCCCEKFGKELEKAYYEICGSK